MLSEWRLAVTVIIAVTCVLKHRLSACTCEHKMLDNSLYKLIIVFTEVSEFNSGAEHAAGSQRLRQAKGFTATRHTQSTPSGCTTSSVPGQRFLRPGRHDSGQVRDAPAGSCRQRVSFSGGPRFWAFPAVVLPDQRQLRAGWPVRAGASETRPQKRSQTHAGSDGIRSGKANIGSVAHFPSAGGPREDGFQGSGSPAQHRATASAGKKRL